MATNLLYIRRLVRDRLGHPMHDDYFTDPLIDSNINLAILAVEEEHRWPWNEIKGELLLLSGEAAVPVPEDWRATKAITFGIDTLEQSTIYDLDRIQSVFQSGRSNYFTVYGAEIRFAPFGGLDQTFNHYYYREPKLLVEDEDTIRMPSQHVGTVVAKASQLCSIREDDRPSAETHMVEYMTGLERMHKDVRATTRPQQKRIRPGNWV